GRGLGRPDRGQCGLVHIGTLATRHASTPRPRSAADLPRTVTATPLHSHDPIIRPRKQASKVGPKAPRTTFAAWCQTKGGSHATQQLGGRTCPRDPGPIQRREATDRGLAQDGEGRYELEAPGGA